MVSLLDKHVNVADESVAVIGLAFKPGTNDTRIARSIPVIEGRLERDADVVAYDSATARNMRERFPDIEYAESAGARLKNASAALVVTEWDEIGRLGGEFDNMAVPIVIDGRQPIDRRDGIIYEGPTW